MLEQQSSSDHMKNSSKTNIKEINLISLFAKATLNSTIESKCFIIHSFCCTELYPQIKINNNLPNSTDS